MRKDIPLHIYDSGNLPFGLEYDNGKFELPDTKVRIWITKLKRNVIKIATIDQAILLNINTCQFKKTKK
jgi:hypothetical protein